MNKQFLTLAAIFVVMANSHSALAAFSIEDLHIATKTAVENFRTENVAHVEHFTGYKAWKSGEDSKVKVYVTHDGMNMEFSYLCHKHDESIECHAQ